MTLDIESVVGCGMKREKSLRGSHAPEPLHLPLPSSGRLMGILRPIVAPPTTFMAFCDPEMDERNASRKTADPGAENEQISAALRAAKGYVRLLREPRLDTNSLFLKNRGSRHVVCDPRADASRSASSC